MQLALSQSSLLVRMCMLRKSPFIILCHFVFDEDIGVISDKHILHFCSGLVTCLGGGNTDGARRQQVLTAVCLCAISQTDHGAFWGRESRIKYVKFTLSWHSDFNVHSLS